MFTFFYLLYFFSFFFFLLSRIFRIFRFLDFFFYFFLLFYFFDIFDFTFFDFFCFFAFFTFFTFFTFFYFFTFLTTPQKKLFHHPQHNFLLYHPTCTPHKSGFLLTNERLQFCSHELGHMTSLTNERLQKTMGLGWKVTTRNPPRHISFLYLDWLQMQPFISK